MYVDTKATSASIYKHLKDFHRVTTVHTQESSFIKPTDCPSAKSMALVYSLLQIYIEFLFICMHLVW